MNLETAVKEQNFQEMIRILTEDPPSVDGTIDGLWIPFYVARLGNEEMFRYIVEYSRASFNVTDEKNRDILHYGTESGNLSLVRYMVEKVGMSPVRGDVDLITPFDLAHQMGYQQIETYFEEVCQAKLSDMYRNPILTGMHPDPSIVRVGEDYYMVNSSFIYFPCIPISHSKDLIHWEVIGHAITNPEWARLQELEGGRGYWAPDISYYEGKFYITATYRLNDTGTVYRKQMVTSSEKPEGPYCEPVFLDEDGIDPSIFTDDDGKRYMILNRGARIFEISPDGKKQLSKAKLLYYGHQKRAPEGSHLLKKDGYYYLFQAEGGTGPGHRISVSRSKTLFGNYEPCPYNPIMRQTDEKAGIQRCGHGKPVQTPNGEWYMVYLCGRQIDGKYSMLGRETALDPITWNLDGWPMVNRLQGPSVLQKKPNLKEEIVPEKQDDFSKGILSTEWVSPRAPEKGAFTFEDGYLKVLGSREPLSTMYARNILVRRQCHFQFVFQTEVKVPELSGQQNLGITCYYDENTYLTYGISKQNGAYWLSVTEHIGDDTVCAKEQKLEVSVGDRLELRVSTNYLKRSFSFRNLTKAEQMPAADTELEYRETGVLENVYYLCDEGIRRGKRFTGAMVGIYAYSGQEENRLTGAFRNMKYSPATY
ncbi:MAG: family 43 glycosylhydrolase [Lachnospiraceae bacterium]|nr:family 43 glycosylhydrolase [Lachnospiraceae bacterium]